MGTPGTMIGANAVIGWADREDAKNTKVEEYNLQDKLPWMIQPIKKMGLPGMGARNIEFLSTGLDQALIFERYNHNHSPSL
jgi:hypothetical protein